MESRSHRRPSFRSSAVSPSQTENDTNDEADSLIARSFRDAHALSSALEDHADDDDDDEDFIYAATQADPRRLTWAGGLSSAAVSATGSTLSASADNYPYLSPNNHLNSRARAWNAQKNFRRHRKWLRRRSGVYDEDGSALIQENNGIRVWYDDYTTIDWIHDYVKERVRLRKLRSLPGIRGWFINAFDSMQGWLLMFLIGITCGCVAAGMDISTKWLSDLKQGICTTDYRLNRNFCCWSHSDMSDCTEWKPWSQALFGMNGTSTFSYYVDWMSYLIFGVMFATLAALIVNSTGTLQYISAGRVQSRIMPQDMKEPKMKYFAAGSGIPEVKTILSGFVIRGFLGIQTLWVKVVALTLSVASGLALGRQGPLVHISCCIGNVFCRISRKYNKNEGKRREILSASAAAGVAVAFGAPIGGVLFSLEEVSYYFPSKTMWRSFFCALTAALTLKLINPWHTGKLVLFQVTYKSDWHSFDMVGFIALAIFGGLYGAFLNRFYQYWIQSKLCRFFHNQPVQEVTAAAILTALVSYGNIFTRVEITELVAKLFSECTPDDNLNGLCVNSDGHNEFINVGILLLYAMAIKLCLLVVTTHLKVPAGLFIPSMAVGACLGRVVGLFIQYLHRTYPSSPFFASCPADGSQCTMPGVYALIGAVSTLSGVTRMTVSLAVIVFELTGALTYILPIMVAIMISKWVADGFSKLSIYDIMINHNGHPYLNAKLEYIRDGNTNDVMERGLELINVEEENTVAELTSKLEKLAALGYADGGFPIIEGERIIGYIACTELEHAINKVRAKGEHIRCYFKKTGNGSSYFGVSNVDRLNDFTAYIDRAPLVISPNTSMDVVLELFMKLGLRYLCVVRHGRYIGMIHKKRLLSYLRQLSDEYQ